ncbi:MAG: porin family protein [Dysgonomonas sp.]
MKTTIKTILITVALLLGIGANAQNNPLVLGVKAGVNLSNFSGNGADGMDAKVGFNVGLTVDYALSEELYLLSGLELTMKGAKDKGFISFTEPTLGTVSFEGTEKDNPMYLQIPVHLGYKIAVMDGTKVILHAGPYVAYGIGGKSKVKGSVISEDEEIFIDTDFDFFGKDRAKRFDFGLGLGAGFEFGKTAVGLGYDFGLVNMFDNSTYTVKNMNAYLTLGYKF